jgi:hypothetical protein
MRQTGERRRGPDQGTHDAVDEQNDYGAEFGERRIREIVRSELRLMFGRLVADDRTYSTRAGCGPAGYSRDAWRDLARRIGRRRGRFWIVTRDELDKYERREPQPVATEPASAWSPAAAARSMHLRSVGGR